MSARVTTGTALCYDWYRERGTTGTARVVRLWLVVSGAPVFPYYPGRIQNPGAAR
jgi:hypothetical protein